jgi:hypothetical protein
MGDNAVPTMKVGFNYPWAFDEYGFNFGPVFFFPSGGLPAWKNTLPQRLDELKGLGITIVRWFILMNGLNYGKVTTDSRGEIQKIQAPTERSPIEKHVTLGFDTPSSGWEFDPPNQLHPLFIDHFKLMLQTFRDKRLQVVPSLVDFPFFAMPPDKLPFDKARGLAPRDPNSGGGRTDVMTIPNKRQLFFDTVLEPLLQASVPFANEIFAWEVMNEPSWLINTLTPVAKDPKLKKSDLVAFLNEALRRIESHPEFAEKSTVGHRFHDDLENEVLFGGLPTGKIPQFHYYGKFFDNDVVPKAKGKKFVGEIAVGANTLFAPRFRANQAAPWPELQGADASDTVFVRLKLLAKLGYKEAFIWPDEVDGPGHTDRVKLSAAAQLSLKKFTGAP